MSNLKKLIKESPLHERRLEFKTFPLKDDRVITEGWLRDERLVGGYHWGGRVIKPGIVHWIGVRLLLAGSPLTILDAESEMTRVPHEECRETSETVRNVIGLSIATGFSDEVRKRIGGVKGCSHMMHLILAMGPAALHGHWTQQTLKSVPVPDSSEADQKLGLQVNSCMLWREGGPLIQKMRAAMDRKP